MFRIRGRSPTPPHQPTAGRQTPEAVGCRVLLGSAGGSLRRTAPCQMPRSPSVGSESSPTSGGRRRGPQPVMQTAEDEIQAVLQSAGLVQYLQRWRLLAITLTCRCRRTVQMQVLRQHTDGSLSINGEPTNVMWISQPTEAQSEDVKTYPQ
nr:unnamed protein product [Spirometra erinaceieuropaei]